MGNDVGDVGDVGDVVQRVVQVFTSENTNSEHAEHELRTKHNMYSTLISFRHVQHARFQHAWLVRLGHKPCVSRAIRYVSLLSLSYQYDGVKRPERTDKASFSLSLCVLMIRASIRAAASRPAFNTSVICSIAIRSRSWSLSFIKLTSL